MAKISKKNKKCADCRGKGVIERWNWPGVRVCHCRAKAKKK